MTLFIFHSFFIFFWQEITSKDIIGLFEIIPNSIEEIIIVIITNKSCYIVQIV